MPAFVTSADIISRQRLDIHGRSLVRVQLHPQKNHPKVIYTYKVTQSNINPTIKIKAIVSSTLTFKEIVGGSLDSKW